MASSSSFIRSAVKEIHAKAAGELVGQCQCSRCVMRSDQRSGLKVNFSVRNVE